MRIVAFIAIAFAGSEARAQDGTWSQAAAGTYNWSTAGNWVGGVIANGSGNTANFNTANLTGAINVTLDTPRTIGNILFDNPTNVFSWSLVGTNALTLAGGTPTVTVNNAGLQATIATEIQGTSGLAKVGPGTLLLSGNNTFSGGINVQAGTLAIGGTAGNNPLGSNALTLSAGTLSFRAAGIGPVGVTGFNHDVVTSQLDFNAGTPPFGTSIGFDIPANFVFYERGVNVANPVSGLPFGGRFTSAADSSTVFQLEGYGDPAGNVNNVLLLSATTGAMGTLTLANPAQFSTLNFLNSAANGSAPYSITLRFQDGTSTTVNPPNSPDWFNGGGFAISGLGRINRDTGLFDQSGPGSTNPRMYQFNHNLSTADQAKLLASIDFNWTGGATNSLGVFALSGVPVTSAQVFANNVTVTSDSVLDVRGIPSVTLGSLAIGSNVLGLTADAGSAANLGATTMTGNPTFSVGTGATLSLGALNDGGVARTLDKTGLGSLVLGSPATSLVAGTQVNVGGGNLTLVSATSIGIQSNLAVNLGRVSLSASQTVANLAGTGGQIRLNGNALTVNGSGSQNFAGAVVDGAAAGSLVRSGTGTTTLSGFSAFTGGTVIDASSTLVATQAGSLGAGPITLRGTLVVGGAQTSLAGFGGSGVGYTTNGNANIAGDVLQLTADVSSQIGSAFNNIRVPTGAFTASFRYNATAAGNPADGATFVLHNDPRGASALGGGGGSLGYGTSGEIINSVAFALNIFADNTRGVAVFQNGLVSPPYTPVPNGVQLFGTNVDVTLNYDGTTLSATLFDGTNTATFTPPGGVLDLPALLGGQAFIGFTGATGDSSAQQSISNFQFSTPQGTTYANPVNLADGANGTINVAATASAFSITMGPLTFGTGSSLTVGAAASTPANQAYALTFGAATITGNTLISVANNGAGFGSVTLGSVSGPGATLSKLGTGHLILPFAGTYSGGTNINGGRLIVTNTTGSATGTGLINVNTNATLGGTGIIGGNIQVNGGTIAPGDPLFPAIAPGRLTANQNVTFSSGTFLVKLKGTTAGVDHDQLLVSGTVSIGNNVAGLSTSLGYAPAQTDSLVIIQGGTVSAGQFIGLPNNAEFVVGTFGGTPYVGMIQYTSSSVFISNFQPVPEPAHMLVLCGLGGAAWQWRRRRMSR